jgi:cytochrome b561
MSLRSTTDRYGGIAIAIHWTSAALIIAALAGGLVMANTAEPAVKQMILPIHATLGSLALLLTLTRIGWWIWGDRRPRPVAGMPPAQEWAARAVHALLYLAVVVLGASGIATLVLSGAIPALLSGAPLPDFSELPPRLVHGLMGRLLLVLLAAHVGAALYHHFIRRDHLLARMGVGAGA